MRTMRVVAALAVAVTLAGCGTTKVLDGVTVRGCRDRTVRVINESAKLEAANVKVCRGNSLTLTFRNPVAAGRARTRQASSLTTTAPWLDADNTATGIKIDVPTTVMPMEYKYDLEVDGIGLLDPRIVVQ